MREQLDMALLEVKRMLSAATCWLAIALRALGLKPVPQPAFGSAENRYLQRFEGFQTYEDGLFVPCAELEEKLRPAPGEPRLRRLPSACCMVTYAACASASVGSVEN